MKIRIVTDVWVGEFDPDEFPHYVKHEQVSMATVKVTEEFELDVRSTVTILP